MDGQIVDRLVETKTGDLPFFKGDVEHENSHKSV